MEIKDRIYTTAVHAGTTPEATTGAIMTPIFQTSTYVQSAPGVHQGFDYSRAGNPTRTAYEETLARMENATYGHAFSSGLAAEQAIIQMLEPGSAVIVSDDVYGGTGRLFRRLYAKHNLDFRFINLTDLKATSAAIDDKVKLVWIETPTNPTMKVVDIAAIASLAKASGAKTVVDNTFATPIFQQPLVLGADLVVHSTTKYIGGHSDVVGGAVMTNDQDLSEQLGFIQLAAGAVPGPFECFLLQRSVKTLAVRMARHAINAQAVAEFLADHKKVQRVYFPGLKSDPGHNLATEQMSGFSGMVSFDHAGTYDEVVRFLQSTKVFALAESLGGVESLVNHPERMTHASVPEDLRRQLGIGPQLVRLSVGIEGTDDLIDDLKQALET